MVVHRIAARSLRFGMYFLLIIRIFPVLSRLIGKHKYFVAMQFLILVKLVPQVPQIGGRLQLVGDCRLIFGLTELLDVNCLTNSLGMMVQ
jgi:hypothetical protein